MSAPDGFESLSGSKTQSEAAWYRRTGKPGTQQTLWKP